MVVYHEWLKSSDPETMAFLRSLTALEVKAANKPPLSELMDYLESLCILRARLLESPDADVKTVDVSWSLRGIKCNCINFPLMVRSVQAACYALAECQHVEDEQADRKTTLKQVKRVDRVLEVTIKAMGCWVDVDDDVRDWGLQLPRFHRWVRAWCNYSEARLGVDTLIDRAEQAKTIAERLDIVVCDNNAKKLAVACVQLARAHRLLTNLAPGEQWPMWASRHSPSVEVPMFYRDREMAMHSIINYAAIPLMFSNANTEPDELSIQEAIQNVREFSKDNNWSFSVRFYLFQCLAMFQESIGLAGKALCVHYAAIYSGVYLPSHEVTEEAYRQLCREVKLAFVGKEVDKSTKNTTDTVPSIESMMSKFRRKANSPKQGKADAWLDKELDLDLAD